MEQPFSIYSHRVHIESAGQRNQEEYSYQIGKRMSPRYMSNTDLYLSDSPFNT
ncbi:MAG: hypothetical protein LUF04_07560 [Bacteroides sp.]|nr:hypothetical protein [Bacteroides sp.]